MGLGVKGSFEFAEASLQTACLRGTVLGSVQ